MNLVEFIFAFSAVFGSTLAHYFGQDLFTKLKKQSPKTLVKSRLLILSAYGLCL